MPKIKTAITIESNESLTVRRKRYSIRAWCDQCRRVSIMVLPTEARFLSGQDMDLIVSLMLSNALHVRHFDKNRWFICLTSLCLFSFDNEFSGSEQEFETERLEVFTDSQTGIYKFINEE
ncbi:MAG: hypothetical protein R2747_18435 [Pyrinomonadaceae bacterium]